MKTIEQLREFLSNFNKKPVRFNQLYPKEFEAIVFYTSFLTENSPIRQRFWHINQNIFNEPLCEVCNKKPKLWLSKSNSYSKYCSQKCSNSDNEKILKSKNSMVEKYGVETFQSLQLPEQSRVLLADKQWLIEQHHILQKTQQQIANEIEVNPTTVGRWFDHHQIEKRFFYGSQEQRDLADTLRSYGITVRENVRMLQGNRELDIVLPDYNVAIEYCGIYWHCDCHSRITKNYHKEKFDECAQQGIRLITIFQTEWADNRELVLSKILNICKLSKTTKLNARDCYVKPITNISKNAFHSSYHIQGTDKSQLSYGLFLKYEDTLVSCLSGFINSEKEFTITRFSSDVRYNVRGSFSKMLKYVERNVGCTSVVTFADLRWSIGDLYSKNGFDMVKIIEPTFYYYENKKKKLLHRSNFMKHKILSRLNITQTDQTEFQLCDNMGLLRIWDCGKLKFRKKVQNGY